MVNINHPIENANEEPSVYDVRPITMTIMKLIVMTFRYIDDNDI